MSAIRNNHIQETGILRPWSGRQNKSWRIGLVGARIAAIRRFVVMPVILFSLFLGWDIPGPLPAYGAVFKVTPFSELTINSEGQDLRFPTFLFYDRSVDETYVVDGAKAWVVVYAGDFFPLVTFASGRGINRPQGGFIDPKGLIYICQHEGAGKPARITVLNGAFMVVREIPLDNIPNVSGFSPRQVAVSHDGFMYVAGQNIRGVAVLDNDGNFLRWLRPKDETFMSLADIAALDGKTPEIDETAEKVDLPESSAKQEEDEFPAVDIPEQFRPKTKKEKEAEKGPHIGPVVIRSVTIDSAGRLYLLSDETSKTYVYNPDESFLFSFGVKGGTPRTLSNPRCVAIDEERHIIYVVDYMRHAILAYSQKNGDYLFEFGGKGKGPGWFNFPTSIAVNQRGQVIVADLFNHRVQVLSVTYQPEYSIDQQPQNEASPAVDAAAGEEQVNGEGEPGPDSVEKTSEHKGDVEPVIETNGVLEGEEARQNGGSPEIPDAETVSGQEGLQNERSKEEN